MCLPLITPQTFPAVPRSARPRWKIFALPLQILPFVSRGERTRHARRFGALRDASDVPHAIAAFVYGCEAIVAYDDHFAAISNIIPYKNPEDYL